VFLRPADGSNLFPRSMPDNWQQVQCLIHTAKGEHNSKKDDQHKYQQNENYKNRISKSFAKGI
jgi:hypothetical protein